MTDYIEPEDVDELVDDEGFHFRDRNGLLSALASPMPVFGDEVYPGIHQKAAMLISAINHNHPLLDGNKRLSWFVTVAFYDINGYDLHADAADADRYIRLIADATPPPPHEVELWLDKHTDPLE